MNKEQIEKAINNIRSKHGKDILDLLWVEKTMYHGDLAGKLSISPSGLNGIIKKMIESEIPLIKVEVVGKFRKYSLSDEMKEYMDASEDRSYKKTASKTVNGIGLFVPIQRFVEAAGDGWREILNQMLCGDDLDVSENLQKCFNELMDQIEELSINNEYGLQLIKKFIKNEVLIYLIEEYIAGELGDD